MKAVHIVVNDRMQKRYRYQRTQPAGQNFHPDFKPELTPGQMLALGVFEGKYMTDCRAEFPPSWFAKAKLAPDTFPHMNDPDTNYPGYTHLTNSMPTEGYPQTVKYSFVASAYYKVTLPKVEIVQSNEFALVENLTNISANLSSDNWTNVTWRIEPYLGATGALFSVGATNIGTTNLWVGTNVWIWPGDIGTNYMVVAYANELTNCFDIMHLRVLDVYPKAPMVYTFAGHSNDVVDLDVRPSDTDYVWSLASGSPTLGTFDAPSNSLCQFLATTTGNNTFHLRCRGVDVWTKAFEVIPVTSRSAWDADAPDLSKLEGMSVTSKITVHHSSNTATGTNEVQRIQDFHMSNWPYLLTGNNWGDIGYHYLQAQDAEVFEGRQLEGLSLTGGPYTKGSHVAMNNTAAGIGFCLMADYESGSSTSFTATRQLALEKALTALCRRHNLTGADILVSPSDGPVDASDRMPGDKRYFADVGHRVQRR